MTIITTIKMTKPTRTTTTTYTLQFLPVTVVCACIITKQHFIQTNLRWHCWQIPDQFVQGTCHSQIHGSRFPCSTSSGTLGWSPSLRAAPMLHDLSFAQLYIWPEIQSTEINICLVDADLPLAFLPLANTTSWWSHAGPWKLPNNLPPLQFSFDL